MNPMQEMRSADGVSLVDLAPPVYVVTSHEIPTVCEFSQFSMTKKCHTGSLTHFVEWYLNGHSLEKVFQSRAKALERIADIATQVANQKVKEALAAALAEGKKP